MKSVIRNGRIWKPYVVSYSIWSNWNGKKDCINGRWVVLKFVVEEVS